MSKALSKVKEVQVFKHYNLASDQLKTGKWVLLKVRVAETAEWRPKNSEREGYVCKGWDTIFVLGRVK